MEIGLVSCSASKRDTPSQPKGLYMESALFRKARRYCEQHHDEWYVLSAKHGLLDPDGPQIESYDESLTNAGVAVKREWGAHVANQLRERGLLSETLVFHAGKDYYEPVLEVPEEPKHDVPTEGLRQGEKLHWHNEQRKQEGDA
jgi:hypothetical protein